MATQRQIEANRKNAQKSTGPRSLAGKASSSRNAIKHGLASASLLDAQAAARLTLLEDALSKTYSRFRARQIASAELRLARIREVRTQAWGAVEQALNKAKKRDDVAGMIAQSLRLDRYEKREVSRRKRLLGSYEDK